MHKGMMPHTVSTFMVLMISDVTETRKVILSSVNMQNFCALNVK